MQNIQQITCVPFHKMVKSLQPEGIDFVDKMVKHFRCQNFADFTFTAQNASGFDSYI